MNRLTIRRSTSDRWVAGVCGGLAEAAQLHPTYFRVIVGLGILLLGVPGLIAYLLLATVVPAGRADEYVLTVDWQSDGVRMSWPGPIAPHAISWRSWWGAIGGFGVLSLVLGTTGGLLAMSAAASLFLTTLWVAAHVSKSPRTYALTVTHDALWLERPFLAPLRLPLAAVEILQRSRDGVSILLHDGDSYSLPPAPDHDVWASVRQEVSQGRIRASAHAADLEKAADARRRVEKLLR